MTMLDADPALLSPVTVPASAVHRDPADLAVPPLAAWTQDLRPSVIQRMLSFSGRADLVTFALGLPAPELFPAEELAAAAGRVLRGDPGALQYKPGVPQLKEQVVRLMAERGVACQPEQVLLTTAAQQGLSLLSRVLLEPGGTVLCEELVYMGFKQVIESYRPRILHVGSDLETGMDVDAVERHLDSGERPAFIYCITDGHNPLGCSLSRGKRERLVELARRHRVPILEDDAYGMLYYERPEPPLRALDDRWVFYVGSFSKVLAPSLRLGWIVAPRELVPVLGCAKDGADLDMASLAQRVAAEYLAGGGFPGHLERVRAEYRERRDLMLRLLAEEMPAGSRWSTPVNGALLWLELPERYDTDALLEPAMAAGVAYVPGEAFAVPGSGAGRSGMRLNFSYCGPDDIREGMARLGRVVRENG
ncbi:MAG TPA: PLP-dependent aminotransferase family protein [Longimicrobium sp.]|jgi:2-aminoadipate transaminase|nr:PLP-dependent aminotransferase family protein [Longimicrobium sp.]